MIEDDPTPSGAPEWVVTYGDMMSLLLTFFIMLVSLSEVVADQKYRAVLEAIHQYIGYRSGPVSPPGTHYPLNALISQLQSLGAFVEADSGSGGIRTEGVPGSDFRVFRSPEGNPILVGDYILFAPGEAALAERAREQLTEIVAELAGKPNKVEVRAHAAPGPLPANASVTDKTILTYERARAVLLFLEQHGIDHDRLRLTATADAEPLPDTGDRTSTHNDRVEVLILDTFVEEYVGPDDLLSHDQRSALQMLQAIERPQPERKLRDAPALRTARSR